MIMSYYVLHKQNKRQAENIQGQNLTNENEIRKQHWLTSILLQISL
jgi:hypothetical protein